MSAAATVLPSKVSAFCDDALGTGDAVEVSRRIASGEVSGDEVLRAAIARARAVNPVLNAIAHESFETALLESKKRNTGGRFNGLPTFIKDTDAVAGTPLRMGSGALPPTLATKSSGFIKQFLSTGLVSIGKSTLPELGLTATTESLLHGPTRNPWNTAHSTGGSSGGSAALVAAGVVPLAHANDGGGSIRIPASCCGLVGLKPSRGRLVGADGSKFFPIDIIAQGVLTRTVRDTAAFLAAAEKVRPSRRYNPVGLVEGPSKPRLRIACFTEAADGTSSDAECQKATHEAARILESLGHSVEYIPCPFEPQVVDDFFAYWGFPSFGLRFLGRRIFGAGYDHSRLDQWSLGLAEHFRKNLRQMPATLWRLKRFARHYDQLFDRCDVLLSPTLTSPPVALGYISPDVAFDVAVDRVIRYATHTPPQNLSGGAAISLPLGRSSGGLPIGVHFASNCGSERRLLELAFEMEGALPWPTLAN